MFRERIGETPLTSSEANGVFTKIHGDSFNGDVTFLATLRALIYPRMNRDDPAINLSFMNSSYDVAQIERHGEERVFDCICPKYDSDYTGIIHIYNFNNTVSENNQACMKLVEKKFIERNRNWQRIQKVTDFFKKSFGVICFIDPEDKSVVLFCESLNIQKMHYLQCGILAFLPWYFNSEEGVKELEMRLINSLRGKDADEYKKCMAEFAAQYDFRTQKIRNLLDGFELKIERAQLADTEREIRGIDSRINDLNTEIGRFMKTRREKEIWLFGLMQKIAQEDSDSESEIMEYFLHNKHLTLNSVGDDWFEFSCRTYLEYFNEDIAEKIINNKRSYVYYPDGRNGGRYIDPDDMEMLMRAIFIEQTLRMKFCATYRFSLTGDVRAKSHADYGYEFRECIPNPHIDEFACIGDYLESINEFLKNKDYIGAIEQCVSSCKSLNLGEAPTMERFMSRLYGMRDYHGNNCCIELPDGKVVNPKEAIEWLKQEKGEETDG